MTLTKKRVKYVIINKDGSITPCRKAIEMPNGWLEYSLADGKAGVMQPGRWRKS